MPVEANESGQNIEEKQLYESESAGFDVMALDLSNERLIGLEMQGADLSNANLSKALIAGSNLAGANLSHARLIGTSLAGVNLDGANFSSADIRDSKWIAVKIEGADFGGTMTDGVRSVLVDWSSTSVPPANKPGPMVTPFIFMPLVVIGGVFLSLFLKWKYRKRR